MREMVLADKKLFLYIQKREWSLDKYTREFLVREEVCEEIRSTPGKCLESARLAASADDRDYGELAGSANPGDIAAREAYIKSGQQQYLAVLYFKDLNNTQYADLEQEVHNGWRT